MKRALVIWTVILVFIMAFGFWAIKQYSSNVDKPMDNNESLTELNKTYCTPADRKGDYCIQVYSPVCGWMGPNVQCIKYPCAGNYGNSCEACHNSLVEYYTSGECPN